MAWTYSGNPSSSPKDEVRFILGDTEAGEPQLTDEEINFALQSSSTNQDAAILCCKAILAKMAKKVDYKLGPETVNASDRTEHYRKLLKELQGDQVAMYAAPSASLPDRDALFDIGMHDNNTMT